MQAPQYKKPQFPACRGFNRMRGIQDGFVNMTELAIRFLAQQAARSQLKPDEFANKLKKEIRGIATVWESPKAVLSNASQSYIIQLDMIADRFFRNLRDDVKQYKMPIAWIDVEQREKLPTLKQLLANMKPSYADKIRKSAAFALVDYYRLVRNDIIHDNLKNGRSVIVHEQLLTEHQEAIAKEYPGFEAPNAVSSISFDDFRVFTRALDRLAPPLNDAMDLTGADIARVMLEDDVTLNVIRKRRSNKARLIKMIQKYCYAVHGMGATEAQDVHSIIDAFLATDPTCKERRRAEKKAAKR